MRLSFRELLPPNVQQEMDQYSALLQGYLYAQHKSDGSHADITADSITMNETAVVGNYGPIILGPNAYLRFLDGFRVALDDGNGSGGPGAVMYLRGGAVINNNLFITAGGTTPFNDAGDVVLFGTNSRIYDTQRYSGGMGWWTDYTPVWTASVANPSLGAGAGIVGSYTRTGNTVRFRIRLGTSGATTFGTGSFRFSLPVAASASFNWLVGSALVFAAAGAPIAQINTLAALQSSTTVELWINNTGGRLGSATYAWGDNTEILIEGAYEAA